MPPDSPPAPPVSPIFAQSILRAEFSPSGESNLDSADLDSYVELLSRAVTNETNVSATRQIWSCVGPRCPSPFQYEDAIYLSIIDLHDDGNRSNAAQAAELLLANGTDTQPQRVLNLRFTVAYPPPAAPPPFPVTPLTYATDGQSCAGAWRLGGGGFHHLGSYTLLAPNTPLTPSAAAEISQGQSGQPFYPFVYANSTLCNATSFSGFVGYGVYWFQLVGIDSESEVTLSTCSARADAFDTDLSVWAGTCDDLRLVACNGDAVDPLPGPQCQPYYSQLTFRPDPSVKTYFAVIGAYGGYPDGTARLQVTLDRPPSPPPPEMPWPPTPPPDGQSLPIKSGDHGEGDAAVALGLGISLTTVAMLAIVYFVLRVSRRKSRGSRARFVDVAELQMKEFLASPVLRDVAHGLLDDSSGPLASNASLTSASGSDKSNKFASEWHQLITGHPKDSALGVVFYMKVGEEQVRLLMNEGVASIIREIEASGSRSDLLNLDYVLNQPAQELEDDHGFRDHRRSGERLNDFVEHTHARLAQLTTAHCLALRLYTTSCFRAVNSPLRDVMRLESGEVAQPPQLLRQHPLPATVAFLTEGIKRLRAVGADTDGGCCPNVLWRGMKNIGASDDFVLRGGTELAPMSTTSSLETAARYALSPRSLLFMLRTSSFIERGADLTFLSAYPDEAEFLFPPLTFLNPIPGAPPYKKQVGRAEFTVIQVQPQIGS